MFTKTETVVGADVLRGVAEPGPVLTLLREFPPCEGVVWGCYAEASQAAHRRMAFIADTGAEQRWRGMGAQSPREARGLLMTAVRREMGVTAWLYQARLVEWRLRTVGMLRQPAAGQPLAVPAGPAEEPARRDAAFLARLFLDGLDPIVGGRGVGR